MIYRNIYVLVSIVLIFIVTYIGFIFLSKPTYGKSFVGSLKPIKANSQITSRNINQPVQSNYFNLTVPSGFVVQKNMVQLSGNLLEVKTLTSLNQNSPIIIQIGIYNDSGSITTNSSYNLRINNPNQYIDQKINGVDLTYSNSADGVVCFWQHANNLATISVTTGLQQTTNFINNEISIAKSIIYSWQWK